MPLILLTGGALFAIKEYRARKARATPSNEKIQKPEVYPIERVKDVIRDKLAVFDTRNQQLDLLLSDEEKKRRLRDQKKIDRDILIAAVSLGFASAGKLFWPLNLLSLPAIVYIPLPTYKKALELLKQGEVGVPTLFTISAIGATLAGYFWVSSLAVLLFALAFKFCSKVMDDSRSNLVNVFRQSPKVAWVLVDGVEVQTRFEDLKAGQTIVVGAGETIPVDGAIIQGMATVDQHILTGEARPAEKGPGEKVYAATLVLSGRIHVVAEKAGEETTVAQIGHILNHTLEYKAQIQLRVQSLADRTVFPTLMAGAFALPMLGSKAALTVIDAHFKNKMNILAPVSLMTYLNLASQQAVLIKDGRSLDLLSQVDTIVFDKTGTLTEQRLRVGTIHTCAGIGEDELLLYAAAAEHKQTHPIAKAIIEEADKRQLRKPSVDTAEYKVGYGIAVRLDEHLVQVGSDRFMEFLGYSTPDSLTPVLEDAHANGHSLVLIAFDGVVSGAIELLPCVRPEARDMISALRRRPGIRSIHILSGDHEAPTRKLAADLGIDHYFSDTLPGQKAEIIQQLIDAGRFVCYVGDGINDAIALKKSHVSISLCGASSVATDTAQIIMMNGDLKGLDSLFELASEFRTNTNITFALILIPSIIGIGGALFLEYGILHTTLLNLTGLFAGLSNSVAPLIKERPHNGVGV